MGQPAIISCIILILILSTSSVSAVNETAEALTDIGVQEAKQHNDDDAIISFDQALQLDPDYALAWYNRGISLDHLGRKEEALISFNNALQTTDFKKKRDTYFAELLWFNRGAVLADLGQYEESVASYDEVLLINPRDAGAWNNRGNSLASLGRYDEAIASFDTAIKITDMSTDNTFNIGRKNRDRVLAEQKNATSSQQQIQTTPLPTTSLQQTETILQPTTSLQSTQKAPFITAPSCALALVVGLFFWIKLRKIENIFLPGSTSG